MPLIPEFQLLPPAVYVYFPAMRAHHKSLGGIKSDWVHIPIPLTVKERPFILEQSDTFVTSHSIFFQTGNIDSQLDAFALLKKT
jgi:hypothetical protein